MRYGLPFSAFPLLMFLQAPLAMGSGACTCLHFDKIKQELQNAETLRDRFARKAREIADIYNNNHNLGNDLRVQYVNWLAQEAQSGIARTTPGDPQRVEYVPGGREIYDHEVAQATVDLKDWVSDGHGGQIKDFIQSKVDAYEKLHFDMCAPADPAFWDRLKELGPCKEVGDTIWRHERSHYDTCRKRPGVKESGYFYFERMRPPQARAEDEAKAYTSQVNALKELLKKVLNGAKLQYSSQIDLNYAMGPTQFSVAITSNPAMVDIPRNTGLDFSVKLESQNSLVTSEMQMSKDMVCTVSPTTRTEYVSIEASAGNATVRVDRYGASSPSTMLCRPGGGGAYQAPPTPGGGQPVTLPLKLTSSLTRDLSSAGTPADFPGISIVGKQSLNLNIICPRPNP